MKYITAIFGFLLFGCANTDEVRPNIVNNFNEWCGLDQDLFNIIQDYRKDNNLSLLIPNKDLHDIAINRLQIVKNSYPISHDGVGDVFKQIKALGYDLPKEVLAYGYSNNESVFNAFLRSEQHKKAIIENNQYIGVNVINYNKRNYYILIYAN